jgi:hypothetical protein
MLSGGRASGLKAKVENANGEIVLDESVPGCKFTSIETPDGYSKFNISKNNLNLEVIIYKLYS